jgi:hypothetical protein
LVDHALWCFRISQSPDQLVTLASHLSQKGISRHICKIEHFLLNVFQIISGGYRFFSDLLNKLNALNTSTVTGGSGATGESVQISIEFIRVKSYLNDKYVNSCILFPS